MRLHFGSWIFKIWPLSGFDAITLPFGIYFRKPEDRVPLSEINHELVHVAQIKKLGVFQFYFLYLWEYLRNIFKYRDLIRAYEEISFEKEAYAKEDSN